MAQSFYQQSSSSQPRDPTPEFIGCNFCFRHPSSTPQFFRCSTCKETLYCSQTCQSRDWPEHKTSCFPALLPAPQLPTIPTVIRLGVTAVEGEERVEMKKKTPSPLLRMALLLARLPGSKGDSFRALLLGTYLSHPGFTEHGVYTLLIDAFRLRKEDEWIYQGITAGTIYEEQQKPGGGGRVVVGAGNTIAMRGDLERFLGRTELMRPRLLPTWWSAEKRAWCVNLGDAGFWEDLGRGRIRSERRGDEGVMTVEELEGTLGSGSGGQGKSRWDGNAQGNGKEAAVKKEIEGKGGKDVVLLLRVLAELVEGEYVGCCGQKGMRNWL